MIIGIIQNGHRSKDCVGLTQEQEKKDAEFKFEALKHHVIDRYMIFQQIWLLIRENKNNIQRSLNKIAEIFVEIQENTKKTNVGQSERDIQYAEFQSKIKDHMKLQMQSMKHMLLLKICIAVKIQQSLIKIMKVILVYCESTGLLFQPILTMMIQLSSKSDSDTAKKFFCCRPIQKFKLQKVKEMMNQLKNNKVSISNNSQSDQRQNLEQAIQNYQSIIEESEGKVEYYAAEVKRNQINLEGQDQSCRQQQDIYQLETQSRVQSQDLISRISDHIQDKIVTLKNLLEKDFSQIHYLNIQHKIKQIIIYLNFYSLSQFQQSFSIIQNVSQKNKKINIFTYTKEQIIMILF
ncbi:unnamed protein product [Paramecium sonneborni]|uniref:Uncharacterized protein n=1 Tax=Paramecium sonneborni TaxID=65129 RepID=A0A8S1Q7U9_9CILI|nr:unnamed protein product [Paramecium sonneborni]